MSRPVLDRSALRRLFRGPSGRLPAESVELGAVCALLAAAAVFGGMTYGLRVHGGVAPFGQYSGQVAAYLVGVGGCALAYARARGLDVDVGLPRRGRLGTALAAVVAPAAVTVLAAAVLNSGFGTPLGVVVGEVYSPRGGVEDVLRLSAARAAFEGVGFGLLCVAAYASIRHTDVSTPSRAVALAAGLLAYFRGVLWDAATTLVSFFGVERLVLFGLLVAATVAAGVSLGLAYRSVRERSLRPIFRPAFVPVYALGLLALFGAATAFGGFPDAVEHLLWACAFAAAAYGYERTRSVWAAVAAVAVFRLGLALVGHVEAVLGLTGAAL
jgi:hypothetical protein